MYSCYFSSILHLTVWNFYKRKETVKFHQAPVQAPDFLHGLRAVDQYIIMSGIQTFVAQTDIPASMPLQLYFIWGEKMLFPTCGEGLLHRITQ